VHVLELLNKLTEVLTLPHVLKHVRLLLTPGDLYVQSTVVCRSFYQLLNCSNTQTLGHMARFRFNNIEITYLNNHD